MQKKAVDVVLVLVFSYLFFMDMELEIGIRYDRRLVISFIDMKKYHSLIFSFLALRHSFCKGFLNEDLNSSD